MAEEFTNQAVHFRNEQLQNWPLAATNYAGLNKVKVKSFVIHGFQIKVQFNPERVRSTTAKVDASSIKNRTCFLCKDKRPKEQAQLQVIPNFELLINPFPIFPVHFTIPSIKHTKQRIKNAFNDLLEISKKMEGMIVFYNGPFCGASAPDHLHFQAISASEIHIIDWAQDVQQSIITYNKVSITKASNRFINAITIASHDKKECVSILKEVIHLMEIHPTHDEPMFNILCQFKNDTWQVVLIPREKHRPKMFFAEGDDHFGISPASVDLGGVFVLPYQKDFERINEDIIQQVYTEVCYKAEKFSALCDQIKDKLEFSKP